MTVVTKKKKKRLKSGGYQHRSWKKWEDRRIIKDADEGFIRAQPLGVQHIDLAGVVTRLNVKAQASAKARQKAPVRSRGERNVFPEPAPPLSPVLSFLQMFDANTRNGDAAVVERLNINYLRNKRWQFDPSKLDCRYGAANQLGKGSYGEVFRGMYDGKEVAVKVVSFMASVDRKFRSLPADKCVVTAKQLFHWHRRVGKEIELQMCASANRSSVTTFGCLFTSPEEATILMERYPGTLSDYLRTPPGLLLTLDEKVALCLKCVDLLIFLQRSLKAVHSDIKGNNILYKPSDGSMVLTDYGVSMNLDPDDVLENPEYRRGNGSEPFQWNRQCPQVNSVNGTPNADLSVDLFSMTFIICKVLWRRKHSINMQMAKTGSFDLKTEKPQHHAAFSCLLEFVHKVLASRSKHSKLPEDPIQCLRRCLEKIIER